MKLEELKVLFDQPITKDQYWIAELPLVRDCIGIEQCSDFHNETVFEHLFATLIAACELSDNYLFRIAALFHDVGKPSTKNIKNGKIIFHKHNIVGETLVRDLFRKSDLKDLDYVCKLIRYHMFHFPQDVSDKSLRRWLKNDIGEIWHDLFLLRCADRKGNRAKEGLPMWTSEMMNFHSRISRFIDESKEPDGRIVFYRNLLIPDKLKPMLISCGIRKQKRILDELFSMIFQFPQNNNKEWIEDYIRKHYLKEKL